MVGVENYLRYIKEKTIYDILMTNVGLENNYDIKLCDMYILSLLTH